MEKNMNEFRGYPDELYGQRDQRDDRKKKKKPVSKKRIGIILLILVLIAGSIYVGGAQFYKNHMFRDTVVNQYSLANLTVQEAENTFTQDLASHQITLIEKERKETIKASDVGVSIDIGDQIKDLKAGQNEWEWPAHFFGSDDSGIHLNVSYDDDKVIKTVEALQCCDKKNITPPADAYLEAEETEFVIKPEVLGNRVRRKRLKQYVRDALTNCVTEIDLVKEDLYHLPDYYAADQVVKDALAKANKYAHAEITYDYGYKKETLDYSTLKDWIKVSKDFEVTVKKDSVGDYVAEMQRKYNTMGVARKHKTVTGEEITIVEGDYGWKVDYEKEKKKLLKNIKSGKEVAREPEWEYRGVVRNGERDDIGDTYVEVSIDQQEVWMVVDGEAIASDACVTGNPNRNASTTKGVYSITFKKTPATLTGPDAAGGSYSSDVTYWMPFNGNQGLHDAPWRDDFGGSIYKSNGSHGCVNLPYSMAETIWNHVKEGYPVIIY